MIAIAGDGGCRRYDEFAGERGRLRPLIDDRETPSLPLHSRGTRLGSEAL